MTWANQSDTHVLRNRVAPCAGLAARMSTQMRREREEQQRLMQEEVDFERIMSLNLGPMKSLDSEQEVANIRNDGNVCDEQRRAVRQRSLCYGSDASSHRLAVC